MSAYTLQVKRMVISTYQAASGAGQAAMDELELQTKEVLEGKEVTKNIFPFQVSCALSDLLKESHGSDFYWIMKQEHQHD